jgi:hypothetical protein
MKKDNRPRRTPEETWKALEKLAAEEEAERISELSDEQLDAELREGGFDPARVRAEGAAFAKMLLDRRDQEKGPAARLAGTEERLAKRAARRGTLTRDDLRARIETIQSDPRLKLAVGFRNRDTAAADVPELEAMLEEMEDMLDAAIAEEKGN